MSGRSKVAEGDIFRVQFSGRKGTVGQTEAAQRGGECNSAPPGSKADLSSKLCQNRVNLGCFARLSRLDDVRGLRIQTSLRSRRPERSARAKRHRVLFHRLPRHRARNFRASRPVIDRRGESLVGKRIVVVHQCLVLVAGARDEIRHASELRMAATQPGHAADRKQTLAERGHAPTLVLETRFRIDGFDPTADAGVESRRDAEFLEGFVFTSRSSNRTRRFPASGSRIRNVMGRVRETALRGGELDESELLVKDVVRVA